MLKNTHWLPPSTLRDEGGSMQKWVRKFVNIERPGLTNGTDSFVEWYEDVEEVKETLIKEEEKNEN